MSRLEQAYGAGDVHALFGDSPITTAPWPQAGRRKDVQDYDKNKVRAVLLHPEKHEMIEFDPRTLRATQPSLTRAGVSHYMAHPDEVYADKSNAGNQRPHVYVRNGQPLILSGHHRAATALLRGEQFKAVPIEGGYGSKR